MLKKVEKVTTHIGIMTQHGGDKRPRIHLFNSLAKAVDFFDDATERKYGDMKPKWLGEMQIEEHD
jgi:hypothetical protein